VRRKLIHPKPAPKIRGRNGKGTTEMVPFSKYNDVANELKWTLHDLTSKIGFVVPSNWQEWDEAGFVTLRTYRAALSFLYERDRKLFSDELDWQRKEAEESLTHPDPNIGITHFLVKVPRRHAPEFEATLQNYPHLKV
jgi:hypothetical protein